MRPGEAILPGVFFLGTGSVDAHATYFKYSFLNTLRDELWLTMTRQRVTLFLLLYVMIPSAGFGISIGWGKEARSPLKIIIGCAISLAVGVVIAWALPRLLWNMLRLFARKGWFLQPEHPQSVPVMTRDEFIARSEVLRREGRRQFWVSTLLLVGGALGCARLAFYLDRAKPESWIQGLAAIGILVFFAGYFFFVRQAWKRRIRKLGLQCLACGREITAIAGLSGVPDKGLCRHCGTKVIEI